MYNLLNMGPKVKKLREFRNISQEYMAGKLKISQAQYSRLESGESNLKENQLNQISELLDTSVEDIAKIELDGKVPFINNQANNNLIGISKNTNYYQIDPNLEKYYQDYIMALKENISLLKDRIKNLEEENKALKQ